MFFPQFARHGDQLVVANEQPCFSILAQVSAAGRRSLSLTVFLWMFLACSFQLVLWPAPRPQARISAGRWVWGCQTQNNGTCFLLFHLFIMIFIPLAKPSLSSLLWKRGQYAPAWPMPATCASCARSNAAVRSHAGTASGDGSPTAAVTLHPDADRGPAPMTWPSTTAPRRPCRRRIPCRQDTVVKTQSGHLITQHPRRPNPPRP